MLDICFPYEFISSSTFCAGLDLAEVHQLCSMRKRSAVDEFFFDKLRLGIAAPFHCSKPVACSLDGHAIAGGMILALACDYIALGTRKPFRIGLTELLVGVPFPQIPIEIVRHQLEPQLAQRLIFDGNTINSNEFTIQCDRTETPDDSSIKWLKMVCDRPLEGFQISKKKWWKSLIELQTKDNEVEKEEYFRAITSTECLEAMKRTIRK